MCMQNANLLEQEILKLSPWYNDNIHTAKQQCHQAEKMKDHLSSYLKGNQAAKELLNML